MREEKRLQVFENKVLRNIFGPKRDAQTGEWRRLHNGELHDLYGKPDLIRIVSLSLAAYDGQGMWHEWEMKEGHGNCL